MNTVKNSVAKTEPKKDQKLMFAGAQSLLSEPKNSIEVNIQRTLLGAAKALNVSPFGVNLLGNVPYINKLGLNQKMAEYNSDARIVYEWVHISENDDDKAVCKAKLVNKTGDITDWIIGECSPKSTKMGTLAGYQNHMAQTRSHNRAIQEAYGVRIHEDMLINLARLQNEKVISEKEAEIIGISTITSADEIVLDKKTEKKPKVKIETITPASQSDVNLILKLSDELGKKINLPKDLSKVGANKIITALMEKKQKNGK